MNIKLKNLRSAEEDLGKFLGNVVVTSELVTSICGDEVNDAYLEYVIELNNKVSYVPDACETSVLLMECVRCTRARMLDCGIAVMRCFFRCNHDRIYTTNFPSIPCRSSTSGKPRQHRTVPAWKSPRQARWRRKEYSPT